ncbi:HD-GYP domain-containing protein [Nitratidesulfovibrio liaohensis]|uniref:HD-GYP domain-containing protein n=1 Tax=Nitratidesulfovibrio liaohensis TaxID=2604158 RepID=A0ABY9QZ97_9BACT|nr:HD-GYP domain-containing protein [Nitratidesulfovibrio liaohensis]WMW64519.1 HD-GYP domain-containing protein [Nitratidesulfovibrio liaohensis]
MTLQGTVPPDEMGKAAHGETSPFLRGDLRAYGPLLTSLALSLMIVWLVVKILLFGESVISYYTPTILAFEDLMVASEHLRRAADTSQGDFGAENIAAQHFLHAEATLRELVYEQWPKDNIHHVMDLFGEVQQVAESLSNRQYGEMQRHLSLMMPLLEEHVRQHKEELMVGKRNIKLLATGIGLACLLVIAMGLAATVRERKAARLYRRESEIKSALTALISALDAREPYTKGHSGRVAEYAAALAKHFGIRSEECRKLYMGALLHDIGKIGVPDSVLLKEGKLTDEEFAVMKQHPVIGERLLAPVEFLAELLPAIRNHHERHDGRGYPDKLAGEGIPFFARCIAVADAYDAMTTDRPYRKALTSQEARAELLRLRNVQWDAAIVDAFLIILDGDVEREEAS